MSGWLRIAAVIVLLLPFSVYSTPPVWAQPGDFSIGCLIPFCVGFDSFNPAVVISFSVTGLSVSGTFTLPAGTFPGTTIPLPPFTLPSDVTVAVGGCTLKSTCASVFIPASSFQLVGAGTFVFRGTSFTTSGVQFFEGFIFTGINGYAFQIGASGVSNLPVTNPTAVFLQVGAYRGTVTPIMVVFAP